MVHSLKTMRGGGGGGELGGGGEGDGVAATTGGAQPGPTQTNPDTSIPP
jgi:hypothetical protein